jgi:hypothetical protein
MTATLGILLCKSADVASLRVTKRCPLQRLKSTSRVFETLEHSSGVSKPE